MALIQLPTKIELTKEQKIKQAAARVRSRATALFVQIKQARESIWAELNTNVDGLTREEILTELGVDGEKLLEFKVVIDQLLAAAQK